jgi:hypothetical protein
MQSGLGVWLTFERPTQEMAEILARQRVTIQLLRSQMARYWTITQSELWARFPK